MEQLQAKKIIFIILLIPSSLPAIVPFIPSADKIIVPLTFFFKISFWNRDLYFFKNLIFLNL